ncbi:MAG TPA: hypothetical protein VIE43_18705 [Thermoanaerobaculia bacterium]|jgi:hypothetical protein|nr:hypothetical protein [Thermoanaerobaculia bacterium]
MNDDRTEPLNAFSQRYLAAVQELDDPGTAREAETSGPLSLVEEEGQLALYHGWESAAQGDAPLAVFRRRETALLFQAIWPAIGRNNLYRLASAQTAGGYGLEEDGQLVGSLHSFDPGALVGGHFASFLARTPLSLALLVEAAGPTVQRHVGRILLARVLRTS